MKWNEQILQLNPYEPGKPIEEVKREYGLDQVVKLASNENPYGQSAKVREKLTQLNIDYAIYPNGNATDLRSAVASFLNVKPTQLIFGNGTDEVLQILSQALLGPEKNTVMAKGTFSQYKHNAVIEGAEIREVPLKNGYHDLDNMLEAIDEDTAIVWLCSPNNPTGTYIKEKEIKSFLNRVPKNVLVVLDEAYYEYVVADDYYDALSLLAEYENLLVTRTFSKIYGLASFRVGYGIASERIIQKLEPIRQPFNTNVLGQYAAAIALKDQDFVTKCRRLNREGLKQFYDFCQKHGLSYYESQANFILIDFARDGDDVFQFLLKNGFIVRSGKALGFPTCIRITVGTAEQNNAIIQLLEKYLSEAIQAEK